MRFDLLGTPKLQLEKLVALSCLSSEKFAWHSDLVSCSRSNLEHTVMKTLRQRAPSMSPQNKSAQKPENAHFYDSVASAE